MELAKVEQFIQSGSRQVPLYSVTGSGVGIDTKPRKKSLPEFYESLEEDPTQFFSFCGPTETN